MIKKILTHPLLEDWVAQSAASQNPKPNAPPHGETESLAAGQRKKCLIPSCDNPAKGRGLCGAHWFRWRHKGDPMADIPLKGFRVEPELLSDERGSYVKVPTTLGFFAFVDVTDLPAVSKLKWFAQRKHTVTYARAEIVENGIVRKISMHKLLLKTDSLIDHADGNGLNNRRYNMRLANSSTNQANKRKTTAPRSSKFKGVTWDKERNVWKAGIEYSGHNHHLGRFDNESDAAKAYDVAAVAAFGEFAKTNFTI